MYEAVDTDPGVRRREAVGQMPRIWTAITFVGLALGFALTFDPSFVDPRSVVVTLLPFLLLPTLAVAYTQLPARGSSRALTWAAVASVAAWTILVLDDERWAVLTFALYGLSFSIDRLGGLILAGVITSIWMIAWLVSDGPTWRLAIPVAVFVVSLVVWVTLFRAGTENTELAELVEELRTTQHELAIAEREKGVLEERARVAGEIHDTLAQGFTSIVVLSRAARRHGDWQDSLDQIESVASENLQAARRLVAAIGPVELESASLPDAMRRHVDESADENTAVCFTVVGSPRPIVGAAEVALWRGLQEAVLNARRHGSASRVHVTLSYLDDLVVLDVRDDGTGFATDVIADRGDLTGGQGLRALRQRAESLGGHVEIESDDSNGTVVSIRIPAETP